MSSLIAFLLGLSEMFLIDFFCIWLLGHRWGTLRQPDPSSEESDLHIYSIISNRSELISFLFDFLGNCLNWFVSVRVFRKTLDWFSFSSSCSKLYRLILFYLSTGACLEHPLPTRPLFWKSDLPNDLDCFKISFIDICSIKMVCSIWTFEMFLADLCLL